MHPSRWAAGGAPVGTTPRTMLAILGLTTIVALLAVIMTRRMTPLTALIVIPVVAALLGGFGAETGGFVVTGLQNLAPVVAMFVFAILFFGVMTDAGLFAPVIDGVVRTVGRRAPWIVAGTAFLAMLVHLDGSGAVTFLVVVPAMLPLYDALGLDRRVLACAASMGAGVMNLVPWGGPTLRAASALHLTMTELYRPLLPAQAVGVVFVLSVAYWLGRREEQRASSPTPGSVPTPQPPPTETPIHDPEEEARQRLRRPDRLWLNVILTVAVLASVVWGRVPPALSFMVGTALALMLNYPDLSMQRARVDAHARAALLMAGILLAAGVFTGILQGTGMVSAMAEAAVAHVPPSFGRHLPVILGVSSMPLSLLFDPDSFYFGILPVVAGVAQGFGVPSAQVAQGALLGQMTTGFPVSPLTPSTFLLVGLAGVDLGEHQRFSIPFLWAVSIVMTLACVAFGILRL